jgi:hypothetical protein
MMMETDSISETFSLKESKRMENIQDCSYVHCENSWIRIFSWFRALITTVKLKQFLCRPGKAFKVSES